jgi:uncharacterized radical SAM superfamily Fe-S cluster-containing enzyme
MNAPLRRSRPYIFWGQTQSLCEVCLALVPAKIEIVGNEVWYEKRCRQHGVQSTLLSTDAAYWRMCKDYIKPGDKPLAFQNRTEFGCPLRLRTVSRPRAAFVPGADRDQRALQSHLSRCALPNPRRRNRSICPLDTISRMFDALIASEGEPDLVQISGGEPTLHPDFFAIIDEARARPIRHVMINTNGLRIAREAISCASSPSASAGLKSICSSTRSSAMR